MDSDIPDPPGGRFLEELNEQVNPSVPVFDFHHLGYGYCPVTESTRSHYVFDTKYIPCKSFQIGSSNFQVPNFMNHTGQKSYQYHRLSFESKKEYEKSKGHQYGLAADINLIVSPASRIGKWNEGQDGSNEASFLSVLYELRLATLQIDSPGKYISAELRKDLQSIPKYYNQVTLPKFRKFFNKWGTHFVVKQEIGGSVQLNCSVGKTGTRNHSISDVVSKAGVIFSNISSAGNLGSDSACQDFRNMGTSIENIRISGGNPPVVTTLEELSAPVFESWVNSVEHFPVELAHAFALYPYYNLCQVKSCSEFTKATKDYLAQNSYFMELADAELNKEQEDNNTTKWTSVGVVVVGTLAAAAICFLKK